MISATLRGRISKARHAASCHAFPRQRKTSATWCKEYQRTNEKMNNKQTRSPVGENSPEQPRNTSPQDLHILSESECADYLRLSTRTLRNHRRARRIPFVRCGGRILYRRAQVDAALAKMEVRSV